MVEATFKLTLPDVLTQHIHPIRGLVGGAGSPNGSLPLAMAAAEYPTMVEKLVQENELNLYLPNTASLPEGLTAKERQALQFVMTNAPAPCTTP